MQTTIRILIIILLLGAPLMPKTTGEKCSVEISLQGIRNDMGGIMIAVFNQAHDDFPGEKKEYKITYAAINKKKATAGFSLPCGKYAVSVFHDENGNKKLDTNAIGIPREGYGFSGNADSRMGPPIYSEAEFLLKEIKQKLEIKLVYLF